MHTTAKKTLLILTLTCTWIIGSPGLRDSSQSFLENILAKEGISLGGEFRSQFLQSEISGPSSSKELANSESAEYTSVDFDIKARPNSSTQGRLIIRMHQDWRNFFSDIANPIFTRWISLDGRFLKMFSYNVGDFREQFSPLTLYAPEVDLLYEPELFARQRQEAMEEEFLGNNDRLLQGVNLNLDAEIYPIFQEFHLSLTGSRLRNVETDIGNGNFVTMNIEKSDTEKFMAGENLDFRFLKGLNLGNTFIKIFDKEGTYTGTGDIDTALQNTSIYSFRGSVDAHEFIKMSKWKLRVLTEFALSSDDVSQLVEDSLTTPGISDTLLSSSVNSGSALYAGLKGEFTLGKIIKGSLTTLFIQNEQNYRNELAQSPTFIGEPVMNIENDTTARTGRTHDLYSPTYSSMDAMYHHVFKFSPSQATNQWAKAPFRKNSYRNSIFTQGELNSIRSKMDPALQLVMPFGPATPNRTGPRFQLTTDVLENKFEVSGIFSLLSELQGETLNSVSYPTTDFSEAGAGARINFHKFFGLKYPLLLSVGMVRSTAENTGPAAVDSLSGVNVTNDFINTGIVYQFWKRMALMGGVQQSKTTTKTAPLTLTRTQQNLAGGLEYQLGQGAYALFSLGKIRVTESSSVGMPLDDFEQLFTNLSLKVKF